MVGLPANRCGECISSSNTTKNVTFTWRCLSHEGSLPPPLGEAHFLCWFYALALVVLAFCLRKKKGKNIKKKKNTLLKVVVDEG